MKKLLPEIRIVKSLETVEEFDSDGRLCEVNKRVRCYELSPLAQCRAFMEDRLGQAVDWDMRAGGGESEKGSAQNPEFGYDDRGNAGR